MALPAERTEVEAPTERIRGLFTTVSMWSGVAAILLGYHVFLGWVFGIGLLVRPTASFPAMTASEAIASVLAGVALYRLRASRAVHGRGGVLVDRFCAGGTTVLGAFAVLQDIAPATGDPPTMAFFSAVAFALIGVALLLAVAAQFATAELLGLGAGALSLLGLTCYIYGATPFSGQMPLYRTRNDARRSGSSRRRRPSSSDPTPTWNSSPM